MSVGSYAQRDGDRERFVPPVQMQGGDEDTATTNAQDQSSELNQACEPPQISYTVPQVTNVGRITNPVERNQAINTSYHAFDTAMTAYLGDPPVVSNWCTYGQHASREAGSQINNLKTGLQILDDAVQILTDLVVPDITFDIIGQTMEDARRVAATIRRINALLQEDGLMKQALQLALSTAGITEQHIEDTLNAWDEVSTLEWSDIIWGGVELVNMIYKLLNLGVRLGVAIPDIITAVQRVYQNMVRGNREIYENIAPAYRQFLLAGQTAPNGVVGGMQFTGDPNGFVAAAFAKYAEARNLYNELYCLPEGDPQRQQLIDQRAAIAHEANLLIGYQEQLVILQPIFDTMQDELEAMNGTMVLRDPNGVHPLVNNWGDFYTRMG
ncbi:MAG: hypothetical protein AAFS10_21870, partial [Myxococcota bacterium]